MSFDIKYYFKNTKTGEIRYEIYAIYDIDKGVETGPDEAIEARCMGFKAGDCWFFEGDVLEVLYYEDNNYFIDERMSGEGLLHSIIQYMDCLVLSPNYLSLSILINRGEYKHVGNFIEYKDLQDKWRKHEI